LAGWLLAVAIAPSDSQVRNGAVELVPNRAWLDSVDVTGSRRAEAVLTPPAKVGEEALQRAIAQRAGAADWSRTGTSSAGEPVYRRGKLEAKVETTQFEPGVGLEAKIAVRSRSLRPAVAAALGALCGFVGGLVLEGLVGRWRRARAQAS
jgi:hypothetical protein